MSVPLPQLDSHCADMGEHRGPWGMQSHPVQAPPACSGEPEARGSSPAHPPRPQSSESDPPPPLRRASATGPRGLALRPQRPPSPGSTTQLLSSRGVSPAPSLSLGAGTSPAAAEQRERAARLSSGLSAVPTGPRTSGAAALRPASPYRPRSSTAIPKAVIPVPPNLRPSRFDRRASAGAGGEARRRGDSPSTTTPDLAHFTARSVEVAAASAQQVFEHQTPHARSRYLQMLAAESEMLAVRRRCDHARSKHAASLVFSLSVRMCRAPGHADRPVFILHIWSLPQHPRRLTFLLGQHRRSSTTAPFLQRRRCRGVPSSLRRLCAFLAAAVRMVEEEAAAAASSACRSIRIKSS